MGKVRQRGKDWFLDYRVNGIRYRETIGPSKKLAQEVLHKRLTEIAENRFLNKKIAGDIEFGKFAEEYIDLYAKNNKKSWVTDVRRIKALKKFFGGKLLHQIDSRLVEAYKADRKGQVYKIYQMKDDNARGISYATVNRELALLKHIFTKAIEWRKTEENPVRRVKLFKENNERIRFLEREEAEKLVGNCKGYLKRIVVIALNTGMRKSEILGLKWRDIDFNRSILHLKDTKNGERRDVPMNKLVKQAVIQQPKQKDSPFVFCSKKGEPYKNIRKSFLAAIKKSGIINFRFHDLRHTFASQLVMSGVDLNTTRELMGHKSLRMTVRYAHLSPAHQQRAVEILDQKWALNGHKQFPASCTVETELDNSLKIKDLS